MDKSGKNKKISRIRTSKKANIKILYNWFYNDAELFLQRKYDKFCEIME